MRGSICFIISFFYFILYVRVKFAATPLGLQTLLNSLDRALGLVGLEISAGPNGKSASLRIDIDGKAK